MAPGIISEVTAQLTPDTNGHSVNGKASFPKPLKLSGALEQFTYEDTTPVIGREFFDVDIVDDLLKSEQADERLRDLAITISQRGVVFFRKQDNLTDSLQKDFVHRLGQLTGKPLSSTLHIHPVHNGTSEFGVPDSEISVISSVAQKALFKQEPRDNRRYGAALWHSDIQFEPIPANYTSLRLIQLPLAGGDTLWASGYELYDRFSPAYRKFLEGLTATFSGEGFLKAEAANPDRVKIYEEPRGSPQNVGRALKAVHPVVRTNPVTGWKSIFSVGTFPQQINELTTSESEGLLKLFKETIERSHDLQVRFKWKNENDIAIWDNRSAFHAATYDYDGLGDRRGNRAVGIGEAPYFDPDSISRTEALLKGEAGVVGKHQNGATQADPISA